MKVTTFQTRNGLMIKCKDIIGTVEIDFEDNIIHGKLINVEGLCLYEGETVKAFKKDFKNAVKDYFKFKENIKKEF